MKRRRGKTGDESVRVAYARQLRQRYEGRPLWECGPFARRVADLESGRLVHVRYWEIRRHCPYLRLDSGNWLELQPDGEVIPVEVVLSADGMRIIGFVPVVGGAADVATGARGRHDGRAGAAAALVRQSAGPPGNLHGVSKCSR